ncbi:hypothetical protein Poli38472_013364 [Pythium oligandrum]|uniref:Uncharacterized protein n=1 Tax=Pythium oligandrum TaxID=41045 RepID=A0A8K1C7K9_PYTOL|nr:hypothetical protein Poli38472_013362 [Pythium oligandrum]TMW57890.1 hypothetical protein Poli38472_013364 [Pythium oligandrum]|eukprot:TMW57888.1 hypothetical protein Poli38472_013362 [Pythium oligandrum]
MGNAASDTHRELLSAPLTEPHIPIAAVNPRFCLSTPVLLHLKEKTWSMSGDDFVIRDVQTGENYFRVDGSVFSMTDRKTLIDASNNAVAHMRKDPFSWGITINDIYADADAQEFLFQIKSKFSLFTSVLNLTFRNLITNKQCRMGLEGDWRARNAVIWLDVGNGQLIVVARVRRPSSTARNIIFGKQDYYVEIPPNVDVALIVLICVAIDESYKD